MIIEFLSPQLEEDVAKQYAPNVWQSPNPWLDIVAKIGVKRGIIKCAEKFE